jgi:GT2 family glycosyltransferase
MSELPSKIRTAYDILLNEGVISLSVAVLNQFSSKELSRERIRKRNKVNDVQEYKDKISNNIEYNHDPKVSFLIQSFNRVENVDHLARSLPQSPKYETVVLEDGSIDGSLERWVEHADRRNDSIIRTNDLHEVRTYTRGSDYSRGDYICLLQDDDTIPEHDHWINRSLELFESIPNLGALGGYAPGGLDLVYDSEYSKLSEQKEIPPRSEWTKFRDNSISFPLVDGKPIRTIDPNTRIPIIFMPTLSVGPIIIDREAFYDIGGFDLDYSDPGEPGIHFEADLTLRLWKNGFKVGYSNMGFYGSSGGGTTLFTPTLRSEQADRNVALAAKKHEPQFKQIERKICEANDNHTVIVEEGENIRPLNSSKDNVSSS